jgi:hypothetical protein
MMQRLDSFDPEHEKKLRAYYGRLQSAFERSNMGGIVEQITMRSLSLAEDYAQKRGIHAQRSGMTYSIYPDGEITAQPMHETRAAGGMEPDDKTLRDYAFVSRRELVVGHKSPLYKEVLAAFFGPLGEHWSEHPFGRIASLYHMTEPGERMLDEAAKKAAPAPRSSSGGTGNRMQRREAQRIERLGAPPIAADVALEQKLRTLHGRMVVLLSPSSLDDHVREGCARADRAARDLLGRVATVWNKADARLESGGPDD